MELHILPTFLVILLVLGVSSGQTTSESGVLGVSSGQTTSESGDLLYPYGSTIDTSSPKSDDGGSLINSSRDIPLFGRLYSSLYVNNNGLLSFQSPISEYTPQALPVTSENPFLAIFWSDVDNRLEGDVYYRQSTDPSLLSRATSDVRTYFYNVEFTAQWVFIATWHQVPYLGSKTSRVNTFQAVLSTDGNQTFLLYNYKDIQWPSIQMNRFNQYGPLTMAGLNSGRSTGYYTLPGSFSSNIADRLFRGNINLYGRWAFRVDTPHPEDIYGDIDDSSNFPLDTTTTGPQYPQTTTIATSPVIFSSDLLYPYGPVIDIINPKIDDGGSPIIYLTRNIPLFGRYYSYLYVNNNGLLSFGSPISQFVPQALPVAFGNPFLAIFWADVDNRLAGDIYYRETTDPVLLSRATSDIRSYFNAVDFTAQWAFVATWHRVAYYGSSTYKVNTFQAVLSTDGNQTFLLYNYGDIQWPSMNWNGYSRDGPLALAGLNSGYDIGYYTLPGSLTLSVANLSSTSNVNVTGRWAFKVDKLHPEDVNGPIDDATENENSTDTPPVLSTTTPGPFTTHTTTNTTPFILSSDLLYPYGSAIDIISPRELDGGSPVIYSSRQIPLFGRYYTYLYVNNNGLISFSSPIGQYIPQALPVAYGNPFLAIFWTDVDNRVTGDIYYRESTDPSLLFRATSDVRTYFHAVNFTAQWVFVVTWHQVTYYGSSTNRVNTFQAVLTTDGNQTFLLYNYDDIQWPSIYAYGYYQHGPLALAGLNSGYDTGYYTLPGSLTLSIANLSSTSNTNVTGRWAFKVDKLHPEDGNGNIDESTENENSTATPLTTTPGPFTTHTTTNTTPFIFSSDLLYPYGSAIDIISPRELDGGSPVIYSSRQIPLFGRYYSYLYVNNNGLISFSSPISQYIPQALPVAYGNPFLAIFWTDVDNRVTGDIYYRESTDPSLLFRATSDVRTYFHAVNFTAQWVFVVTWHRVTYYGSSTNRVNTFQAVLTTDGNQTFLLYNYDDIQWPSIYAYGYYQHGPLALAGLNSGYDTGYYTLPGSLTLSIANLSSTSNTNVTGRWAFKVDKLHPEDGNGNIDESTENENSTATPLTTTPGPFTTHTTTNTTPFILSSDLLYPYGSAIDNVNPKELDGGSPVIFSSRQIPLFGRYYYYLYVNNNGLISFSSPISQYIPQALPVAYGNPFLAIFWADVDNRVTGDIYYRESTDPALLSRATSDVRSYFHAVNFTAQWVFVATWHRVAYFGSSTNRVNTFQAVLTTDGNQTFLLYNYEDIQWPSIYANGSYQYGPLSLAGLNSGYETGYYTLPGSLTLSIANLSSTSNANVTGRWAFKVDKLHPEDINGNIDNSTESENSTDVPLTTTGPFTTRTTTVTSPFILSSDLLYPYGSAIDITSPKIDDGGSPIIFASRDIPVFGRTYPYLYVNNNGLLSFASPISQFTPQALPVRYGNPFLAIFWADVDNRLAGDIYYRESTDPSLLSRATSDIRSYFHAVNFTAQWVFVATWHRVAYFGSLTNKVNTFQAVLSTDGNQTFLLYNYEDIQWPSMSANGSAWGGPLALAGLNSGYATGYYTLPGSLTPSVANLSSTSNVNITGRWAFKVDKLHPEDVNGNIDNSTESENSTDTPLTTTPGPFTTHTTTNTTPFILSSDLLYPYGSAVDTVNPKIDDGGSSVIYSYRAIPLFGRNHSYFYVNNNGLLSFSSSINQFVPQALPVALGNPFLAIFWADIDNRLAGDIYYRQGFDPSLLSRATSDIRTYFRGVNFTARWVLVATWHRVAYYGSSTNKVNTFQAVLTTDGNQTFLLYNYADIQWPSAQGNGSYPDGPLALAGLNSGYDTGYYTLPGSLTLSVANLSSTSNVNVTGRWAFKVDQLHPEDVNGDIDNSTENENSTDTPLTTTPGPFTTRSTTIISPFTRTTTVTSPFILSSDLLYPYGSAIDTVNPKIDDGGSPTIYSSRVIPLFGRAFSYLYVNNNGLLSFGSPISQFTPQALPVAFGNPFLAIFWADVDNRLAGDIYYRETTDPSLLSRATTDIRTYFHAVNFTAQWVFVATYHRVAYFGEGTPNKVNTFQAVLTTDGNQTFLLYNYADIQWPSTQPNGSYPAGPLALAGLNSGYATGYYTLPGSLTLSVANLSSTSNVNVTGRWAFKVDKLHPEDTNGNIDNSTENANSTDTPSTTTPGPFTTRSTTITSPFILSSDLLYPYGSAIDTVNPKIDDGGSSIIYSYREIPLFGRNYSYFYVNNNGLLSFRTSVNQFVPQALPVALGNPFLAIFWADIDNRLAGDIYYRETTDPSLLSRATSDIRTYFHGVDFAARWVLVATWHRVAYYGSSTNKVNTFQAVLTTDGNQTFLLYNYADIQWPSTQGNSSYPDGPLALAGLNSGYNTGYYTLPGSLTPFIANLSSTSNVNVTGRWAFKVDKLHPEDTNGSIDNSTENENSTDTPLTTTPGPFTTRSTTINSPFTQNTTNTSPFILSSDLLYPYGSAIDIINPKIDDGGSPKIFPSRNIPLFGRNYSYLYVNNNGLLSFASSVSQFTPQALPAAFGNPFLAIFWADVNNALAGDIYYRESTDPSLLSRATSDVRTYFHSVNFTAQWVFVATWHRVAYYGSSTNKVNTFQAVLSTDGNQTFLLYNYKDIQWPTMSWNGFFRDGPLALAGMNSGYGTGYYTLPGSLAISVANLSSTSNVNVTGRWAFKVDKLHPEDVNGNIDNSTENGNSTGTPLATASGPITTRSTTITSPFRRNTTNTSPFIQSSDLLYPYGSAIDIINPKIDDGGSPKIFPSRNIPLFGRNYSYLYVNNNGLLSFASSISQYTPQALPAAFGNPFLAIFWADVNNALAGDIYYRESTDPSLLSRATSDVRTYFHSVNFTAQWVFVATWHRVAYYGSSTNKVNTFQAVLSTDGNQTFLLYNYKDIQWPTMSWNGFLRDGPLALAGMNSGYGTGYYTLPGSLAISVANLSSTSNVNVTGRWAFKVDKLHPEDVNGNIDNSTENGNSAGTPLTTASGPITTRSTTITSPFRRNTTNTSPFIQSSDLLYPYGSAIDIINPKIDDGGSPKIFPSRNIPLFGRNYSYLYVNNNGLLSFASSISQYTPQALPAAFGNPFLAIFWADVNNALAGDIYYRESTDPSLLSRATSDIRTYFHSVNFTAQWVFVATWHRVAYYGSSTNKVNTFQAVLSTDGNQTFLLYNYKDIQWPTMSWNGFSRNGPLALAGMNSGYETGYYTLPGSLAISVANLSSTSNVNVTGRWAFKVDKLHPEDVNGNIDNSTENGNFTGTPLTTTSGPITTRSTTITSPFRRNTTNSSPSIQSSDLLYPYGSAIDIINPKIDDGGSPKIFPSRNIPLFGRNYSYLYVNNNGLLSFASSISQFTPQALPAAFGNPFLAIFWADVNNALAGDIYYRESTDPSLLSRSTSDIRTYFHSVNFTAQWVFVATWHRVAYYGSSTNKVNTFQAVLSTDGNQTFLLYNYKDIQWPTMSWDGFSRDGPLALAGMNSGYETGYYTLPGSLAISVANLSSTSNVNVTGRWAFKVDKLHPEDVNGNIDNSTENGNSTGTPLTTASGPITTRSTTITSPFRRNTTNTSPFIQSSDLLYPYGSAIDIINPKTDDGGSPKIFPSRNIPLFGRNYSYLYVNNNGLLSFASSISQFTPQALPVSFGNPFLAIFWADVNNALAGDIYYRESTDPSLLSRATSDIRTYFHAANFTAQWVFVATWHRVAYYGSSTNKVNTFQVVLSTDGNQTFLLYNYKDIQWPSMNWNGSSQDGPLALAGLNSGYETGYYTLPRSLTTSIANLSSTSNVNVTGRWAFKVDKLHPEDTNGNIDNSTGDENSMGTPLTTTPGPITTRSTTITSPFARNTTNTSPFIQSSDLLYPYGSAIDNITPKSLDGGSPMIFSSRQIPLFGRNRSYLYVNNNGLLSFSSPISQYIPQALPVAFGNPFLAIFWTDVDNRVTGDIYYRESTDPALLSRATSDVRTYFLGVNFTAQWVFVATWHQVVYYGSSTNKVNTFQAVLTTDGNQTFLLYNYDDIQWPSISSYGYYQHGPLALAGLNSGYDTGYYTLPGSLTLSVANLSSTSNVNVTGRWAFKVDKLHPENVNGNIDNSTENENSTGSPLTTMAGPITTRSTTITSPFIESSDLLYPYGSALDIINPRTDDGGSPQIFPSRDIPLFGRNYSYLYVNNNGLLSFASPISQFTPQALPVRYGNPFLALFWADVNNALAGDIYYRESTDPSLLSRATSDIRTYFHASNFTAQWVFVATWHRVAYFGSSTNKVNTFQAVLSTDGNQTFLLYNYADIQWPSMNWNGSSQNGPLALAGLNSGYDTGYYTLPGSLTFSIANLSSTSNVNVTGRWAFKVDKLHPEDVNGNIDNSTENETSTDTLLTTTPGPFTTRPTTNTSSFILSSDLLYPYGSAIDNENPKIDDLGSSIIYAYREIPLFGRNYSYLYVNNNGLLSFRSSISQYTPQALPVALGNPFLAIFWADVNNALAGDIYYRESTDPSLLSRATNDIRTYFHGVDFTAQWVLVATWHRVAYYGSSTNKVNTFQAVLTTDGNQTFLLYNYADIQWPSKQRNGSYYDGPLALAGLNSGYNTGYYTLPGSLTPSVANLSSTSNVNMTGRWGFKVDQPHPEDVNGSIDNSTENENSTDTPLTTTPGPFTTRSTTIISPFTRTTTDTPLLIRSSDLLYPYGSTIDIVNPKIDDGGSPMIYSSRQIPLFGTSYSYLYVNNNGLLSFSTPVSQYIPQSLPVAFGNPFLAIFWADVDNRLAGDVYYRESTDPALLSRATDDVRTYFHAVNFTAQWVFVATWHQVAYLGSSTNKVNTFQGVLSTDGNRTFLLYNYEYIQWPSINGNGSYQDGSSALAGLNSGYDTGYFTLPGSLSLGIANLANTSNVNFTGRWAFRVDQLHPEDANGNIDDSNETATNWTTATPNSTAVPPTNSSVQHSTTRVSTNLPNTSPQTRSSTFAVMNTTSQPSPPGLLSANTTSSNTSNVQREWPYTVPIGGPVKALSSTASESSTAGFFFYLFYSFYCIVLICIYSKDQI
ncbi:uncharacterized protein LOC143933542 isoform X4 [Lithobates pipiens]